MDVDKILTRYNLKRKNATRYIDSITRLNQSDTAEEIGISRQTVSRYKDAFKKMTDNERTLLIASLTQEKLLKQAAER